MSDAEINARKNRRIWRTLQILGVLAGPLAVVALVCTLLGVSNRVTAEISITAFLVSTVLLFASFLKNRIHTAFPAILSVILGAILIHLVLTPTQVPPEDKWTAWERQLKQEVDKCDTDDSNCVALAIYRGREYPKSDSTSANQEMLDDLQAGKHLMHIERVKKLVGDHFSIREFFLGNGHAQPVGAPGYWRAIVPEYLVKNHSKDHPDVWTWELDPVPPQLNRKVSDIIGSQADVIREISNRTPTDFTRFSETVREHLSFNNDRPAVIRFGRFPREDPPGKPFYSGKMGREQAKRVFVLQLGPVYNLTLAEAANLSGYTLTKRSDNDKLWIWVYQPSDPRDLDPATWRHIISNVKNWLAE